MNGINYLTMREVAERLKIKSVDTAARWCLDHNIDILNLSNKRVVVEFAVTLAIDQPFINLLKKNYGDRWIEYYNAHKSKDVKKYDELENNNVPETKPITFDHNNFLKQIGYEKPENT